MLLPQSPASRFVSRFFQTSIALMCVLTALIIAPAPDAQEYERTSLPDLGGNLTSPFAINASGTVVGFSLDANVQTRAIRYINGNLETITVPGTFNVATGINDAGKIVGYTVIGQQTLGFLWVNGAVSFLPGINGGDCRAQAINASDIIVGSAADANGTFVPVRWRFLNGNWTLEQLDPVSMREGEAVAINAGGTIVGTVKNPTGDQRAFRWTSGGGIEILPTLGGNRGIANDINTAGVIVGSSRNASNQLRPCVWTNGIAAALPTFGGNTGEAFAIDDAGTVVGSALSSNGFSYAAIWQNGVIDSIDSYSGGGSGAVDLVDANTIIGAVPGVAAGATLWTRTGTEYEAVDLGTLGGASSNAFAINDLGEVVGVADAPNFISRGFLWQDGVMTEIGTFGGATSIAFGINNSTQIVGYATQANNQRRAFLWENGTLTNLGTLGGNDSRALAINDAGVIVGHSRDAGNIQRAFVYQNGMMTQLPDLGGSTAEAVAINSSNLIVGFAANAQGSTLAVQWNFDGSQWQVTPLTDISSSFYKAFGVGDDGVIVGQYLNISSGEVRAFSWFEDQATDLGLITGTFSAAKSMNNSLIVGSGTNVGGQVHALGFADDEIINLNDRLRYSDNWVLNDARAINADGWITGSGTTGGANRAFLLRPAAGAVAATPLSVQVVSGTILSGTLNELLQSDNQYFRTRSVPGFSIFEPNLLEMRMTFNANVPSADTFTLAIESRINNPSGAAKIRFRNWSSNQLVQVAEYNVVFTEMTETIENIPATNFVRASDQRTELSIKHVVLATFSALGFDSFFDQITLESN